MSSSPLHPADQAILEGMAFGFARQQIRDTGTAEDMALLVLRALSLHEVPVDPAVRERVMGCADMDVLERWLSRARRVTVAEDIFVGDG